jgi:putative ABC transport system permease protein
MQLAYAQFRRKYPNYAGIGNGFRVQRMQDRFVGDVRTSLLILSGAVGLVLLIACANVANLLLIRAAGRNREFAIRAALGAARGRIIRQLLIESAMLSLLGGAVGLVAGSLGVRFLLAINPGNIPRIGQNGVTPDLRVLGFTLLISLVTGILFGLMPALQTSRVDLAIALKENGARSGAGVTHNRMRSLLVISETALAVILLIGSALLIRSFIALRAVNPGARAPAPPGRAAAGCAQHGQNLIG